MASKSRRAQTLPGEDEMDTRQRRRAQRQQKKAKPVTKEPRFLLEPLTGLTDRQTDYLAAMRGSTCTFGIGPAGTGKTFCAVHVAAELLAAGEVERIILTRPAVEAGERLGFLPGDLNEKYGHFIRPLRDVLDRVFGTGYVDAQIKAKRIEPVPLAFMRGLNIENAVILADEMQNATPLQTKMLLSRVGEWTKIVLDGDPRQQDIPGNSGLLDAVRRMEGRAGVSVVRFGREDIVRSGFAREVIEAYEMDEPGDDTGLLRVLGRAA